MTHRTAGLILLCAVAAGGCWSDNPRYCESDAVCRDPSLEHYDPAKAYCHDEGSFCYEGCQSDLDCQDPSRSWFVPQRSVCSLVTHDCVSPTDGGPGVDGGDDADGPGDGGSLGNGAVCQQGGECGSGHCVDGVT
jgi:hypothetical protein